MFTQDQQASPILGKLQILDNTSVLLIFFSELKYEVSNNLLAFLIYDTKLVVSADKE